MKSSVREIRVRFAPSPTGYLHIGGARTAIFNWLFAKHHQGKFLLRIEDTDLARSSEDMVRSIVDGLQWLGLTWDEEPIYQSQRITYYQQICDKLVKASKAYFCYCSPKKFLEQKDLIGGNKIDYRYDGHCRYLTLKEKQELEAKKKSKVVRFKVEKGQTTFVDAVHGSLTFNNNDIEDFVILKSDGMPTYHLAVVADDKDMAITNVIRGDDHISNTPKQIMLYNALGWQPPQFAHVPLILGTDKKRLSKRHGATSISEYKDAGYLPEALFNFLVLLGWSPGDNRELFTVDKLIKLFSLSGISKKSAIFDEKKLQWMNDQYISHFSDDILAERIIPDLIKKKLINPNEINRSYIQKAIHQLKPKVKRLSDFVELGSYFFVDPQNYDEKARQKYWDDRTIVDWLNIFHDRLIKLNIFHAEVIEKTLRDLVNELNISTGKLIHPTRLALTGFGVSPGLFELMEALGKDVVLRRIQKAIIFLSS